MIISNQNIALANLLRDIVQERTRTVSDGEGVAMVLLWSFLQDHSERMGLEIHQLAREQLEAFIEYADKYIEMVRPQEFRQ